MAAKPERGPQLCPDCATPRIEDARFCEVCRYDFAPPALAAKASAATPPAAMPPVQAAAKVAVVRNLWAIVTVDPRPSAEYANAHTPPVEPARSYPVDLDELLVGRKGARPNIHPEIPANDPAVSARHLKICRRRDGGFTLVDLGSSNGTKLNGVEIAAHVETTVKPGDEIFIGQWTRIILEAR